MLPEKEPQSIARRFEQAEKEFHALGVNVEKQLSLLDRVSISVPCWQGDDIQGFESSRGLTGAGIQVTGNYPGRAENGDQLREDLGFALSLLPGTQKVNLHAKYAETGRDTVDRDSIEPEHFSRWVDWAKSLDMGLDFNPTFFSHPMADSGFTLSSRDRQTRSFWIKHGIACRKIGAFFGRELNCHCITNIWIPDGYKDLPADRSTPRKILKSSLDSILEENIDMRHNIDCVESKLFGIGSESYVVGSHEFYLSYVNRRDDVLLCLDTGHFHPTESVSDKISSILAFEEEMLLHLSRPVRWDSDQVVIMDDELGKIMKEIVHGGFLNRVYIALDFFDATINRVAAWVIGTRAVIKSLLAALLEPSELLIQSEEKGDLTRRMALMEEFKFLPYEAVWDMYCYEKKVPVGWQWLDKIKQYEDDVLSKRR